MARPLAYLANLLEMYGTLGPKCEVDVSYAARRFSCSCGWGLPMAFCDNPWNYLRDVALDHATHVRGTGYVEGLYPREGNAPVDVEQERKRWFDLWESMNEPLLTSFLAVPFWEEM